jgi:hypothetical protein
MNHDVKRLIMIDIAVVTFQVTWGPHVDQFLTPSFSWPPPVSHLRIAPQSAPNCGLTITLIFKIILELTLENLQPRLFYERLLRS